MKFQVSYRFFPENPPIYQAIVKSLDKDSSILEVSTSFVSYDLAEKLALEKVRKVQTSRVPATKEIEI